MIVLIDLSFQKDFAKIKDKKTRIALAKIIEQLEKAANLKQVKNSKKLSGFDNYYRIRLGDYRIGIISNKNEIQLIRFLHRKDIYKYFP
jgi:mRNA interferase RelE/StbE